MISATAVRNTCYVILGLSFISNNSFVFKLIMFKDSFRKRREVMSYFFPSLMLLIIILYVFHFLFDVAYLVRFSFSVRCLLFFIQRLSLLIYSTSTCTTSQLSVLKMWAMDKFDPRFKAKDYSMLHFHEFL